MNNDGMWVIARTFPGGGKIDEVTGPYWTEAEAEQAAAELRKQLAPRRDLCEVYLLTGEFS